MPAIWGCVDLAGGSVPAGVLHAMQEPYEAFSIDRFAGRAHANAAMGCGIVFVSREARSEPLPALDEESGLLFTADAYLYNRDELIAQLCPGKADTPDGQLLYLGYRAWGDDAPKHIYGSYTFAAYSYRDNRLVLGADHTISRSLYYYREGGRVYFSTLTEPLFRGAGVLPQLNETWMALFLAQNTYAILTDTTSTPYAGVLRMEAAHTLAFTPEGQRPSAYWSPAQVRPLRYGSDAEYGAHFRELMEQCTRQLLRTDGEVAIQQSSGLDSCSVAAMAAPLLAQQGKTLHAYTHVPVDAFRKANTARRLYNEKEGVQRLCAMYPNIAPHFLSTPERNGVLGLKALAACDLFPVKSTTNIAWIDALTAQARRDGCRIMLSGQYGNVTISRGSMETYLTTVLLQGRPRHFLQALKAYARAIGVGRRPVLRYIASNLAPRWLRRRLAEDYLEGSLVNRAFALRAGLTPHDRRLERDRHILPVSTFARETAYSYDPVSLAHVSDTETRFSLRHGIQTLDVTKDIRIIEFCLSLPMECFCCCDPLPSTRRLARVYLGDLLPPEIRAEAAPRGRQSADAAERLKACWPQVSAELERVCLSPRMLEMADGQSARAMLERLRADVSEETLATCKPLFFLYSAGLFIESHRWQAGGPL